ncbi:tyrosine-type recombinase/integrase [Candidatus Chlamydia corallus]|uniref:tyrosine-type recombinase/integrase n=1 Tax=Candidatus Chlamydia corallus TaxID=2038470 RepID=UPI000C2FE859|nr:site-specific integrase [Candidatus Chlamydia corallus]
MRKDNSPQHGSNHIFDNLSTNTLTHSQATQAKVEYIWNELKKVTLREAVFIWISSLNAHTARSYKGSILALSRIGLLSLDISLQEFSMVNHNVIIDTIKRIPSKIASWCEGTKQVRAACYISLTKFLNRETAGLIPIAQPSQQETNKTFYKVRDLVKTNAMEDLQKQAFLEQLKSINYRDWMIALTILQGAKRVNEVLNLTIDKISFQDGTISFSQTKNKGLEKTTIITYPQWFMNKLSDYINFRSGLLFVTKKNKAVGLKQIANTFAKAGKLANISFKVTPHVLRATAVTEYKRLGCSDSDIMKVTGHSSSKMIYAYDKSRRSENASKKIILI